MNPNRGGEAAPQVEASQIITPEESGQAVEVAPEKPKTPESSPSRQPAIVVPTVSQPAASDDGSGVTTVLDDDAILASTPPAADGDKIEREWVDKAKNVIAQTKDDPYSQKNEMSRVKAAYIAKRFNKKLIVDSPASK